MASKKDPDKEADEIVTTNLLAAIGMILFAAHLEPVTKSEVISILKNAELTDTDIAQLYSFTRRRLTGDTDIRPF